MRKRYSCQGEEAWRSAQALARQLSDGVGGGCSPDSPVFVTAPQLLPQVTFRDLTGFPSGSLGLRLPRWPAGTLPVGTCGASALSCRRGLPCRLTIRRGGRRARAGARDVFSK